MVEGKMMSRREANNDDLTELQWFQEQEEKRRAARREKKRRQKERKQGDGGWGGGVRVPTARQVRERREKIAKLKEETEKLEMEEGAVQIGKDRFYAIDDGWGGVKWVDGWVVGKGGKAKGPMWGRWDGGTGKW